LVVALGEDAFTDPRFRHFQTLIEDTYEALLSVPMVSGGEVISVINVHHRRPHRQTPEEIALMKFIGEQFGVMISKSMVQRGNARLIEETAEMKRELETRKLVERAKGLQQKDGISEEDAYFRLRNQPALPAPDAGAGRGHYPARGPRGRIGRQPDQRVT
jgi:GAF domain-containing protein